MFGCAVVCVPVACASVRVRRVSRVFQVFSPQYPSCVTNLCQACEVFALAGTIGQKNFNGTIEISPCQFLRRVYLQVFAF